MKFSTTQTAKTEIEIPVPSFYKDKGLHESLIDLIGILDEKTIVKVFESDRRTMVSNWDISLDNGDVVLAHLNWHPITEEEFMYHYNRALHSLSLTPELIVENQNPVL